MGKTTFLIEKEGALFENYLDFNYWCPGLTCTAIQIDLEAMIKSPTMNTSYSMTLHAATDARGEELQFTNAQHLQE